MSSKALKKQLNLISRPQDALAAGPKEVIAKKGGRKKRKDKQRVAASSQPADVQKKNLAFFKATQGGQGEAAALMTKV